MAAMLRLHEGQDGGDRVKHALDIGVDGAVPAIEIGHFEPRERHDAGIVDQHVDLAEAVDGVGDECRHVGAARDVGGPGRRPAAPRHDIGDKPVEPVGPACPSTTAAPLAASRSAVALPMPLLAPVMTIVLPAMVPIIATPLVAQNRRTYYLTLIGNKVADMGGRDISPAGEAPWPNPPPVSSNGCERAAADRAPWRRRLGDAQSARAPERAR